MLPVFVDRVLFNETNQKLNIYKKIKPVYRETGFILTIPKPLTFST